MIEDVRVTDNSSRTEKILGTMTGDYSGSIDDPQSRVEALLLKLNKKIKDSSSSADRASEIRRVDSLPAKGEDGVIYSIKKTNPTSQNDLYDEWYWNGTGYEHLGSSNVDLSQYVTKEDLEKLALKDTNTTYELKQDKENKRKFSLSGSDGSEQTVEVPDDSTSAFVYDPNTEAISIEKVDPTDDKTDEPLKLSKVALTGDYNDLTNKPDTDNKERAEIVKHFPKFSLVTKLPTAGERNTIYLIPTAIDGKQYYNLYKWDTNLGKFSDAETTATNYAEFSQYNATILYLYNKVFGA